MQAVQVIIHVTEVGRMILDHALGRMEKDVFDETHLAPCGRHIFAADTYMVPSVAPGGYHSQIISQTSVMQLRGEAVVIRASAL